MKRTLVDADYGSSGEEAEATPEPEQKKRKQLPALSSELTLSAPADDPSKHQGRIRSRPFVDGQFAAHVYVPIKLGHASRRLHKTIIRLVDHIRDLVPEMHSLVPDTRNGTKAGPNGSPSLHISLSRPIYLRAHHRDDFRVGVQSAARTQNRFTLSFARISSFVNDENTRIFVSVEVGAGHTELKQLTDSLTPFIKGLHQEPYYSTPRFHFSVAWALLKTGEQGTAGTTKEEALDEEEGLDDATFPSISDIPESLIDDLNKEFGHEIQECGSFTAETIELKIGKGVSAFKLQ
ncbi:poly(U)-specific 3'-to-5' RNA exonuclease [Tulasnella sp. 424]|nr:poly(U)-specific 3'-to-5' RNA exonuclease [Tulasnella sp. 424]KAG8970293.1 poly(U)-specific 3'-to-5' RNA exonuclease [Tulasnella sp. 425]